MRLTQGQVRAILNHMERGSLPFVWTTNLDGSLCKNIRFKWGKWRCTRMHWKECCLNSNGCWGFEIKEEEKNGNS